MKNIYAMIAITIGLFILSMDYVIATHVFIDLAIVIVYLFIVARVSLKLNSKVSKLEGEYTLREKKTAYFAPLIFLFFLSTSISFGLVYMTINIVVIVLLYGYVVVSITRNKIIVSKNTIKASYLNGSSVTMKWNDIIKVDFNWIYNILIFTDIKGIQIKLDISLDDFLLVITMMKERVMKDDYEIAFKNLRKFYFWFFVNSNNIHLN